MLNATRSLRSETRDRAEHKTLPMRPSTTPAGALAALLALICSKDNQPCMCNAFVAPTKAPVRNRCGVPTDERNRLTRTRPHRGQNNADLVQLHASSSHCRYDHLHANARPSANPNNRIYTQAKAETAKVVADQFIEAYLQSLPSLRRHSGDAVIQRSIEAVRRAIASYLMDAGNSNVGGNTGATNALPEGTSAAAFPFSSDADPSPAQQQPYQAYQPTQQLPSAAEATSGAQAAVHQAEAALTDYLDGLSSGQFVSTPSSAEAVGAIRSYLDSLAAVENESSASSSPSSGNVGRSFGQSSYLQYIDEVCYTDDMATGNTEECTRAIGSYLDALEAGGGVEAEATTSSAAGTSRIMGYLDSIAAASSSSNDVAAPGSVPVTATSSGGGYLEALSTGDVPPSPSSWASADTSSDTSSPSFSPAGATPAPHSEDETTINIASTTNIQNINALVDISGEDGVIARSVHEEEGGDTTTETTVTQEGDDTIVTITSTTRIVLPKE